jgi:hypothetical protein
MKIVINEDYGGFDLSEAARELFTKKVGKAQLYEMGLLEEDYLFVHKIPRHMPELVEVVEKLGKKANASWSDLVIEEVNSDYWIIDYDGMEKIYTFDTIPWVKINENN